jgi:hypothetical protein
MRTPQSCDRSGCSQPVITSFREEALCLDHFCSASYEILDWMDEHRRLNAGSPVPTPEQILTADECACRTLDICMSKVPLTNLQRARLLDILLRCGDLVSSSALQRVSWTAANARG